MCRKNVILILALIGISAVAQQKSPDPVTVTPHYELSVGYNYIGANALPGDSDHFGLNGGYVSGAFHFNDWFSIAGEFRGAQADKISMLGQDLTLLTYAGGPRITFGGRRFVPYGQVLFGGAHAGNSYFPSAAPTLSKTSSSSWALLAGGGLDINLTRRFAVRVPEVQYLRTSFANGGSDFQNQIVVGAGLVFKFGVRGNTPMPAPAVVQRSGDISFSCSTSSASIEQGQTVQIVGHAMTLPDKLDVNYVWTTNGGVVEGTGRLVTVNTTEMNLGDYQVTGHASLVSNPSISAECVSPFHVNPRAQGERVAQSTENISEKEFHENVPDVLFDYDSYAIRSDAEPIVKHAAEYLNAHPRVHVLIAGYADERGSAEYNLALGENRANAVRNALISAGVSAEQLEIISYGKEAQICTADNEACWQRNRRAAFDMGR